MSASHYNATPLPMKSAASGSMIQGELVGTDPPEPWFLVRYELAFLAFFGFFNVCESEVTFTWTHLCSYCLGTVLLYTRLY